MRSLYLPLIIFWNAATGQPQAGFDLVFGMVEIIVSFLSILAQTLLRAPNQARATSGRKAMTMILVTGGTGATGGELLRRLSARGTPVRALVRNAGRAAALSSLPGVEVVEGDMARPETLAAALRGIDRAMLISSSDPAMLDVQSNFIDAARQAGVAHVVKLSGIMPELDSPFRFARMHGQIEKHLEASGMAFTHLRAGEFMSSYFRQVPNIVARGALFLPMENAKIASIDLGDIAEVALITLTGSGHEGKI